MALMAKTVITTDDIDGSPNAETVEFSYSGTSYTIDLTKKNRAAFEKVLKPYIQVAHKTGGRTRRPASGGNRRAKRSNAPVVDLGAVRAWAAANHHEVAPRGRISKAVMDAYNNAHT
jgi:nucleoid-associated protein Lsr2